MSEPIIGVGLTGELSLRVSVATLSRVVFPHPEGGVPMIALEHKATLAAGEADRVDVKAQPFGGAIRILNPNRLLTLLGSFNFDSQRSRSEQDFRVYIRPSSWEEVREFCLQNMDQEAGPDLEIDPSRELEEEFEDALGIQLKLNQYVVKPFGIVVENEPAPTTNVRAAGNLTARIYRVYEVQIQDPALWRLMVTNSQTHPKQILQRLALDDSQKGGRGRATAMLVAAEQEIRAAYSALPPEMLGMPLAFAGTLLDGNVPAILKGIIVPKYRYLR